AEHELGESEYGADRPIDRRVPPTCDADVDLLERRADSLAATREREQDAGFAMKVDCGLHASIHDVARVARELEDIGYDGAVSAEIAHDPFLPLVLAAEHTEHLELATGIAVAFARNPMTLANIGHDLQTLSKGRFILGLGSQIKPHIEKRFSMTWSHPAARMRELILAVKAIWACWNEGGALDFRGEFYRHTLMTPMFVPGRNPYGGPP